MRPIPRSGIDKMRQWLIDQTWNNVYEAESAHAKAEIFQKCLLEQYENIFPEKTRKISSDDAPWISQKLKKLDRKRKRIYNKERRSEKWFKLNKTL